MSAASSRASSLSSNSARKRPRRTRKRGSRRSSTHLREDCLRHYDGHCKQSECPCHRSIFSVVRLLAASLSSRGPMPSRSGSLSFTGGRASAPPAVPSSPRPAVYPFRLPERAGQCPLCTPDPLWVGLCCAVFLCICCSAPPWAVST